MHTATPHPSHRRGFTLIELLVVIGIILILIGITFAIGRSVVGDAKKRTTEDTIRVLDAALQAYIQNKGSNPPFVVEIPDPADTNNAAPQNILLVLAFDGINFDDPQRRNVNSVGAFLYVAQEVPEAKVILDKLSSKQFVKLDVDGEETTPPTPGGYYEQPTLPTALDAWGRPIRFVHPKGDGVIVGDAGTTGSSNEAQRRVEAWLGPAQSDANFRRRFVMSQVRRNNYFVDGSGDGDGGKAAGSRPYFYSAGEDGLVGWGQRDGVWINYNLDNVYLSEPTFAKPPQ